MLVNRLDKKKVPSKARKEIIKASDFSQNFNNEKKKNSEYELKEMFKNIKKIGNKLIVTKKYTDVYEYKESIRKYLDTILANIYSTKRNINFWQTQYFIIVDTIDDKLDQMIKQFLNSEISNIQIASTVDEIQGLLLDFYR